MNHADILNDVEIFKELPETCKEMLVELLEERSFENLETVFHAGDSSEHLYIVASGAVALWTDSLGEPIDLRARVERAGVFGEIGVLQGSPRSLTARASGPTTLLLLEGGELIRLAKAHKPLAGELCRAAIGYSMDNQAARAELARRKEARIRVGRPVELRVAGREPQRATLENLSLGGACLGGMPDDWQLREQDLLSVGIDPVTAMFSVHGKIVWKSGDKVGICFTWTADDHEAKIARALQQMIERAKLDASASV